MGIFFLSSVHEELLFAAKMCLYLEIDPDWVNYQLHEHLASMHTEEFAELFAAKSLQNPRYVHLCLKDCALGYDHIASLLNKCFSEHAIQRPPRYWRGLPDREELFFDLSNLTAQAFSALHLLRIILAFTEEDIQTHRSPIEVGGMHSIVIMSPVPARVRGWALDTLAPVIGFLEQSMSEPGSQNQDRLPHLYACLWILKFLLDSEVARFLDAFVDFYTETKIQHSWLGVFLRLYGRIASPFIPLLLDALDAQSPKLLETARPLILKFGGPDGAEELLVRFRGYFQHLTTSLSAHSAAAIALFGISAAANASERHKLEGELERRFGASDVILDGLEMWASRKDLDEFTLRTGQIVSILDQVRRALESNVNLESQQRTIRKICWMHWSFNKRVIDKCTEVLLTMVEKIETHSAALETEASLLFFKMFDFRPPPDTLALRILKCIGEQEWVIYPTRIFYGLKPDQANLILKK